MNPGAHIVAALLPDHSAGVEIGVWKGDSSELFLQRAGHLYLVDPWPDRDEQYKFVVNRFKGERVSIHRMTSEAFCAGFPSQVDWVYIDGLHDYAHVVIDLLGAEKILKPGGVIYGDDYGKKGDVALAVDEYCKITGRKLKLLGMFQFAIT
jgi:predicted O-methyltransferase YrrM